MRWLRAHVATLVIVAALLAGIGLLAYPTVSDWWNTTRSSYSVASYAQDVARMDAAEYARIWADAQAYNEELARTGTKWTFSEEDRDQYERQLQVGDSGVIGYISIDKIKVELPVYLTTSEPVLARAIGHLEGTSLPVGGPSTHTVLSGHRGLPSARLFTDLDKLVEGDTFQLSVLDHTLTYQVDQIRIVEPGDLGDLQIVPDEDLCTLLTCTPYGINTHRLLVRGHRVANPHGDAKVVSDAVQVESVSVAFVLGAPVIALLLVGFLVATARRRPSRDEVLEAAGLRRGDGPDHRPDNYELTTMV